MTETMEPTWLRISHVPSRIGPLELAETHRGLVAIGLPGRGLPRRWLRRQVPGLEWREQGRVETPAARQLGQYLAGRRRRFELLLHWTGSRFQQRAWQWLIELPYGETITYGELARKLGQPGAARAVGAAMAANPLPIVVPCHRVVASGGGLGGYGGGLELKARLLAHEGVLLDLW